MRRSVSTDLELDAGTYSVLMKITAKKYSDYPTTEQVVQDSCNDRQDKLIQIGLAYDLAHAKGQIKESEVEKQARKEREEKKKAAEKQKWRNEFREYKFKEWQINVKQKARDKRHAKRKEERHRRKVEAAVIAKAAAAPDGTTSDGAPPAHSDTTENAPGANGSGQIDQDTAPATAVEPKVKESEVEAVVLPSPPVDSKPAESVPEDEDAMARELSQNFHSALQSIPSVLVNGNAFLASIHEPLSTAAPPSTAGSPPLDSDYDSDASFNTSIDSDLDYPPSPIIAAADAPGAGSDPPAIAVEDDDDEFLEFENDPWNAVCVVGLRVYSKDRGTCVQVVRPKEDDEEESPLDVDDVSKGASGQKIENQVTEEVEEKVKEELSETAGEEKAE